MSLSRLALRLATVEALRPAALVGVTAATWPTIAGPRVYDSRLDPMNDLAPGERRPSISVYCELDNADPSGGGAGGPPYTRLIDVVFETSVTGLGADPANPSAAPTPDFLSNDPQAEAALDLLDYQIRFALHYAPSGVIWRQLTGRRVLDIESLPHRSSEEGIRLCVRSLRMRVRVADDCPDAEPATTPADLARVPDPLKSVFNALGAGSYGANIVSGFAASVPVMPTAVPLKTVGLEMPIADPSSAIVTTGAPPAPADTVQGTVANLDQ